jgi:transcriptional regulator with XRE-family HTH domain
MAHDEISSRRLGAALREARVTAGLSRRETAARAGCTTGQLRAFERGEAQPDDAQMERLALACSRPGGGLVPTRDDTPVALEDGRLRVGGSSAPLRSDDPPTDEVLRSYLGVVYGIRDSKPGTRIPLRDRDLDALATALGDDPEVVETRLVELMDVTREEAAAMRGALIRRRVLLPAASIALAAGVIAGGATLAGPSNSTTPVVPEARTASIPVDVAAEPGDPAWVDRPASGDPIPVVVDAQPGDPDWVTRTPAG